MARAGARVRHEGGATHEQDGMRVKTICLRDGVCKDLMWVSSQVPIDEDWV